MTAPSIPIDVLEQAALRVDALAQDYGIDLFWQITHDGLTLYGDAERAACVTTLSWSELAHARYVGELFVDAEHKMLAELAP